MQLPVRTETWESLSQQPGVLEELCLRLADGETVRDLAKTWGVPTGRVQAWLMADETRYTAYCRALEVHAHTLMSEVVGIAEESVWTPADVGRNKLRIETRFRVAAHHAKARYGEEGGRPRTTVQVVVQRVGTNGEPEEEAHGEEGDVGAGLRGDVCGRAAEGVYRAPGDGAGRAPVSGRGVREPRASPAPVSGHESGSGGPA